MSSDLSLTGLFIASFLAATLLPGGSEAALYALLHYQPELLWAALGVATLGNTLGGLSSYLIGRLAPAPKSRAGLIWIQRYGVVALAFSWLPLVGDALCLAAGWLRLNPVWATVWIAVGKFARYAVIAWIAL